MHRMIKMNERALCRNVKSMSEWTDFEFLILLAHIDTVISSIKFFKLTVIVLFDNSME